MKQPAHREPIGNLPVVRRWRKRASARGSRAPPTGQLCFRAGRFAGLGLWHCGMERETQAAVVWRRVHDLP